MSNVKMPKYDNDLVNLGYLKEVLNKEQDENNEKIDSIPKNYNSPPVPPYYENSTLFYDDKLYRCTKTRKMGSFSWNDWTLIINNKELQNFIDNVYSLDKISIQEQIDSKIDTFFGIDDPSIGWSTSLEKQKHVGDRWRKKTDSGYKDYCYTKVSDNPISFEWMESDVPDEVYDKINKKKSIYTKKPESYDVDDLWIIEEDIEEENIPDGCTFKDWVVAIESSISYDKSHWIKRSNNVDLDYLEKNYYSSEVVEEKLTETISATEKKITESNDSLRIDISKEYQTIEESKKIVEKVNSTDEKVGTIEETVITNTEDIGSLKLSNTSFQSTIQEITTTNKEIKTDMEELKGDIDIISEITSNNFIYVNNAKESCPIVFKIYGGEIT